MSTMIDRWNRIKVSAEGEAQSHPDEIRASRCEGQAHAIKIAIDEFVDACTPRVPRAEWFEKWDAWWVLHPNGKRWTLYDVHTVKSQDGERLHISGRVSPGKPFVCLDVINIGWQIVPVAREGFPAPVGWKVVES